jgi:hypothetical protein
VIIPSFQFPFSSLGISLMLLLLFINNISSLFIFILSFLHVHKLFGTLHSPPHHLKAENVPPSCYSILLKKNIKDNKKIMAFLLVWDKDCYTGRFFMLFPCIWVLKPKLVHLYQTSSLLPSPLPIMASASLRLLYLFLSVRKPTTFKFLVFSPFPIPPVHILFLVCNPCPIILLHLF